MSDMSPVIVAKSDQINAVDLMGMARTIKIASVIVRPGTEQPVSVKIEGDEKVFRPCKSMCRVMVSAWGADSARYVGKSMTIYHDPDVLWAGVKVGGIRISHMSDIDAPLTMVLAESKKSRKVTKVSPLVEQQPSAPAKVTPEAWAAGFMAKIAAAQDRAAMAELTVRNNAALERLKEHPALSEKVAAAIAERNAALDDAPPF